MTAQLHFLPFAIYVCKHIVGHQELRPLPAVTMTLLFCSDVQPPPVSKVTHHLAFSDRRVRCTLSFSFHTVVPGVFPNVPSVKDPTDPTPDGNSWRPEPKSRGTSRDCHPGPCSVLKGFMGTRRCI